MPSRFTKFAPAFVLALILLGVHARADDAKPAPAKEEPASVGEVRTQTLKGFTYFHGSTRAKFQNLTEKIEALIPELKKAIGESHAQVAGPLVFIYQGVTDDPNAEFDLQIGYPIEEKVADHGDFKVRDVPEYHCMSVLFTGSLAQFSSAYEKLMPAVAAGGATKTPESREMYLYFEGVKSTNNVVHVSAGIK